VLLPMFCYAQKQGNICYFAEYSGLDFTTGTPVPVTNGQIFSAGSNSEGFSSICSTNASGFTALPGGYRSVRCMKDVGIGIHLEPATTGFKVYPNPSNGKLNVSINSPQVTDMINKLVSISGARVYLKKKNQKSSDPIAS
ncbi:MAG: hypothetical protein NTV01_02575, partial [Bacteroidia bacterium]|nr:hypothetical protein [Bacteroidia bacterium]